VTRESQADVRCVTIVDGTRPKIGCHTGFTLLE